MGVVEAQWLANVVPPPTPTFFLSLIVCSLDVGLCSSGVKCHNIHKTMVN